MRSLLHLPPRISLPAARAGLSTLGFQREADMFNTSLILFSSMLLKIESIMSSAGVPKLRSLVERVSFHPLMNRGYHRNSSFGGFGGHNKKYVQWFPSSKPHMFPLASTGGKYTHIRHFRSTEKKKFWPFTLTTKSKQASIPTPHPKYSPQAAQVWNVTISSLGSPQRMLTLQQRRLISGKWRNMHTTRLNWIRHY